LPNHKEYLELPEYNHLVSLLEKGIGIHHSGMIPILREIVELMISKRYIKLLFATESFAIGLDCPIKTAIFTSMSKYDGHNERYLLAHEYTQMAGRAGRRGIDTVGYVVHCNNIFNTPSLYEYQRILGGVPQKLVSKFHISYPLILNLLKNGQNSNFHKFSEKSMVYNEIKKSVSSQKKEMEDLLLKIDNFQFRSKIPETICKLYIDQHELLKTGSNNIRKKAMKEINRITNDYKNIDKECQELKRFDQLKKDYDNMKKDIHYTEQYIISQTSMVCSILIDEGFITCSDDRMCNAYIPDRNYELTGLGIIASNIAEIHPLVITRLLEHWNYFESLTTEQIIGIFSCFTDIKLPDDERCMNPSSKDTIVNNYANNIVRMFEQYDTLEGDIGVNTGIKYVNALNFDLIDISMHWCECNDETDCKIFIEKEVKCCGISIGDFTKAMLKIVTITNEWMTVFESLGRVEILHKLSLIESKILKYVTTSQSLYV
jgi:superfamily II RNA helicase